MPSSQQGSASGGTGDLIYLWILVGLAALLGVSYIGVEIASGIFTHHFLPFSIKSIFLSFYHFNDPSKAWSKSLQKYVPKMPYYWGGVFISLLIFSSLFTFLFLLWENRQKNKLRRIDPSAIYAMSSQSAKKELPRLRPITHKLPQSKGNMIEGLLIGKAKRTKIVATWEDSILVIGPPRSGKTSSIVIPFINDAPGAVLATSTRPDVYRQTLEHRKTIGRVIVFDPAEMTGSESEKIHWSPVLGCENSDVALRRANAMIKSVNSSSVSNGDFWMSAGADILAMLLHACALSGGEVNSLLQWSGSPASLEVPARILLDSEDAEPGWGEELQQHSRSQAGVTVASMLATVKLALAPLKQRKIAEAVSGKNLTSTTDLIKENATIHLISTTDHSSVASLISALVSDLITAAKALAAPCPGGRLDPPLVCALDEVANIAALPNLPNLMATAGGEGIVAVPVLQSLSQARDKWGQTAADQLLDSATVTIILPGLSQEGDLRALSSLAGTVRQKEVSYSRSGGGNTNYTTSTSWQDKPALSPSELRELGKGRAFVLGKQAAPIEVKLIPYWNRK